MLILILFDSCSLWDCHYKGIQIETTFIKKKSFNRGLKIKLSVNSIIKIYIYITLKFELYNQFGDCFIYFFLKNNEKINILNKQWLQK